MALFKINGSAVKKITAKELDLEKHLQELFETNLEELLNIVFLAHEYSTSFGGRIDTLGIDKTGSPCIIEYKKNQNDNVINQGLSYLRWLLDHKADFEILCQNKKISIEIDWDSPRVICIAESYNKFDLDTADILPINIELLRYRIYDEDILYLEPENYQKVRISTSGIVKKSKQDKEKTERLQKTYSVNDHLAGIDKQTVVLFQTLREKILALDENIIEEVKAKYIAYKTSTNFTDIVVKQYGLKIFLNVKSGQLNDLQKLARDLTQPKPIGHWGNGDYEVKLEKESELEAVFALIKQSYALSK
jgi:predicted transport protein